MKKYGEVISAGFFVLLSLFYLVHSLGIPIRPLTISSRLVPQLAGGTMFVLAALHLTLSLFKVFKSKPQAVAVSSSDNTETRDKSNPKNVILTLVFITLYVIGLSTLGFLISTVLFLFAQGFLLAPKEKRKPVLIVLASVVCTATIYILFRHAFNVSLPRGFIL
ncbi:MAG: tripartite tricarboxylate transporter TctB family protein [Treponema sp.]|nr:tripartite tricarboxylate transporter TctB family protein [Treponema sp.]